METEFENFKAVMDTEFVKMSENIWSLREDLIKSTDTQSPDNSWVQIVNQKVEDKFGSLTGKVECINKSITEVKAAMAEEVDKENRRNNIVLYRVPESSETSATERANSDARFCLMLFTKMNAGVAEEDVKKIFRLGKLGDRPEPRPILVQLNNRVAKNLIMESAYKLGSMEHKFKSVITAHDMTKLERHQCKELAQEAKERKNPE